VFWPGSFEAYIGDCSLWRGSFEAGIDMCSGLNRLTITLLSSELSCFFLTVQLAIFLLVQFIQAPVEHTAKPVKKAESDSRKAN
jgi:hypothetical protein